MKTLVIPQGAALTEVAGTTYREKILKLLYTRTGGGAFRVSITSETEYQIKQRWPRAPFVNVNFSGADDTTKENWLGYVPIRNWDCDFTALLHEYDRVEAYAKIERKGSELTMYIVIDEQFVAQYPV